MFSPLPNWYLKKSPTLLYQELHSSFTSILSFSFKQNAVLNECLNYHQLTALENEFATNTHPNKTTIRHLASQLNIPEKKVKFWFSRKRWKFHTKGPPQGDPKGKLHTCTSTCTCTSACTVHVQVENERKCRTQWLYTSFLSYGKGFTSETKILVFCSCSHSCGFNF